MFRDNYSQMVNASKIIPNKLKAFFLNITQFKNIACLSDMVPTTSENFVFPATTALTTLMIFNGK